MRGESDRDCRARGGKIAVHPDGKGSKTLKAFNSTSPTTGTPDASLKRGAGPIFRKQGGPVPASYADGGAISGSGSKPSMGRAGRKTGGGVGADLKPLTHPTSPRKPPGRKYMGDSERTP